MHETGKAGAGMAEPPRHHVMPKEFREWFEKRGFTGEMDIDLLARELGKDDVAGVQVLRGLLAEAERRKQVTRFVRDVFVRLWTQSVPEGWPTVMDDDNRFKVAEALGSWIAYTPETHKERARKVSDAILATPPPPGWRPLGPDDPLLLTLLLDEEA